MRDKKIILILLISILTVAVLEICNLNTISLWHDEAFSALLIKYNFNEMMYRIGLDVHPPFYYLVLRVWNFFFDNSVFSLRGFSVFFSLLAILSMYFLVKETLKNKWLALFSSVFLSFNSFQIQYAMEARMYSLALFLVIISTYFLARSFNKNKAIWWILYFLAITAGIYTHYFFFFLVGAQAIFFILKFFFDFRNKPSDILKDKNFKMGMGVYFLTLISYLPWLKIFLRQLRQVEESYWIPRMNVWSIPNTFAKMLIGEGLDQSKFWYLLLLLIFITLFAFVFFLKRIKIFYKWLFFLLFSFPFFAVIIFSIKTPIYMERYFILCLPFYLVIISGALFSFKNKTIKRIFGTIIITGTIISFPIYWALLSPYEKPGMAQASKFLSQNIKANEKIFVGSSLIYFNFKYYNQYVNPTKIHPLLYAPDPLKHYSGTALLSEGDIIRDFSSATKKGDIVWMVNTTGFGNYQPEVPKNWKALEKKEFPEVYQYRGSIILTKYKIQ